MSEVSAPAAPESEPETKSAVEKEQTPENPPQVNAPNPGESPATTQSPFDFPGAQDPALDLLGSGPGGTPTSEAAASAPPPPTSSAPPTSMPPMGMMGMNPMGQMGQMIPPPMTSQQNQNPPTTKSQLAEILGKAEMHQLTSMSRSLEPNQNGPTSGPNGPPMPGQVPPGGPPQNPGKLSKNSCQKSINNRKINKK